MECKEFNKLIYLSLDGRLDQNQERELKEHLAQCRRCQERLSFLELVEGRAKKIEIKEPSSEYWNIFSNRVREKILVRKESTIAFRWKRVVESIFTFSPAKIKIAAGLVSVVLVFIIGKLYIDYHGREIVPSAPTIPPVEAPRVVIPEAKEKESIPKEVGKKKSVTTFEKPGIKKELATVEEANRGAIPKQEVLLKEEQITSPQKIAEEKEIVAPVPDLESQAPIKGEKPQEQAPIAPELKPTGAGGEKDLEKTQEVKVFSQEEAQRAEKILQKGEADKSLRKQVTVAGKPSLVSSLALDHYVLNEKTVPKIEETDTLMQTDEIGEIIQTWKDHIKENPTDSLNMQGYLQIAIGYYLLSKLTQDSTYVIEGSKLIGEYRDQVKDQEIRRKLSEKLEKINALRKR